MKQNFSNEQLQEVINAFGSKFNIRVNRAGNIDLVNPNRTNEKEHFVLYLDPNNKYLWRRHAYRRFGWVYCYPLNMKNRNQMDMHVYTYNNGTKYTYESYNFAKHAAFNTVNEAIAYFKMYTKKYHNINV